MKRLLTYMLMLTALAGCSRIEHPAGGTGNEEDGGKPEEEEIVVPGATTVGLHIVTPCPETKTFLAPDASDGELYHPLWREFDRLRLYARVETGTVTTEPATTLLNSAPDASLRAEFSGDVKLVSTECGHIVRGFAPGESYVFNFIPKSKYPVEKYPWSVKAVRVNAVQNPTPTSFDGGSDILVMEPFVVPKTAVDAAPQEVETRFARATSVLKVVFKDSTSDKALDGVNFDSFCIETSSTPLAGDAVLDLEKGFTGEIWDNPSTTVTANYADGFEIDGERGVLVNVLPGDYSADSFTFTAKAAGIEVSRTIKSAGIVLVPGKITKVSVSIDDFNVYREILSPELSVAEDLRIMQFNVLYDGYVSETYPASAWSVRKPAVASMLRDLSPDIICMNECQKNNFHYLYWNRDGYSTSDGVLCGEYDYYSKLKSSSGAVVWSNYDNVIFYKKNFTLLDSGWFDVDDFMGTTTSDARNHRHAVWVKLSSPAGKPFYVLSTHVEALTGTEADAMRTAACETIVDNMKQIAGERSVVFVTGDMNDALTDTKAGVEPLYGWLEDSRMTSPLVFGNYSLNKFGQYAPTDNMNIDYVFYRNITAPLKFTTVMKEYEGVRYISDHYPVMLDCKL